MELYAHIYKSKLGNLYLLQSTRLEGADKIVFYWTGCMVTYSGSNIVILQSSVIEGENKKDVLSKINEAEKKLQEFVEYDTVVSIHPIDGIPVGTNGTIVHVPN